MYHLIVRHLWFNCRLLQSMNAAERIFSRSWKLYLQMWYGSFQCLCPHGSYLL